MKFNTNYGVTKAQELTLNVLAKAVQFLADLSASLATKGIRIEHSIYTREAKYAKQEVALLAAQVESMEEYLNGLRQRHLNADLTHEERQGVLADFEQYAPARVQAIFVDVGT